MKTFWTNLILLIGFVVPFVHAADVTFNINGKIKLSPCEVTLGNGQTVPLGTYSTDFLDSVGKVTDLKPFEITLDNCPMNYKDVQIKFEGTAATPNAQLLALQPGGAENVGIAIYDNDKTTLIPLNTWSAGKSVSTAQSTTLTFYAAYMSMGKVAEGHANSDATFTLSYN
ncbi:fimbrial protein [Serratia fonticola]|uniref:fimbrial protein n=1 Tax=Serratia fonticola TaxID=47917 RepID=UPI003BB6C99B